MPSISIYRPPAARKLEQNSNSIHPPRDTVGTSSPGKNKLKTSEDSKEINCLEKSQSGKRNENDGMSIFRNAITSIREENKVKSKNVENTIKKNESESKIVKPEEVKSTNQNKQRRPDIQVYVPKGRRSVNVTNEGKKVSSVATTEEKSCNKQQETETRKMEEEEDCCRIEKKPETLEEKEEKEESEGKEVSKSKVTKEESSKVSSESESDLKKTIVISDENSDSNGVRISNESERISEMKKKKVDPEEDDWETMFDDSGECLDPSLLAQLTTEVGEVTLEKPKSSYNGYKTKSLDTVADEFPHVIEIYNFPPEFQLQDLMMVFSEFKNSGFEIKWVDDTHALGIFSSSAIVSQVLDFYHPFVKTRSLKDGTLLSKMKARKSAEFLLPYKPRPKTSSALARRLVAGALGVRLQTSRQEREAEKQLMSKARERRRLEAKQKEDAWEGTFS